MFPFEHDYNVILCDCQEPLEAVEMINNLEETQDIIVIVYLLGNVLNNFRFIQSEQELFIMVKSALNFQLSL